MSKIGMYGGKFLPLHLGHRYCIDVSSQQCDLVYVILFINGDEEERIQKELFYPDYLTVEDRFKKLENICNQYDNVKPIIIDVKECKNPDGSENWEMETPLVRKYIPEMYRVYSSEPSYDAYFKEAYPEAQHIIVDAERRNYPISATMIRNMSEQERKEWMV